MVDPVHILGSHWCWCHHQSTLYRTYTHLRSRNTVRVMFFDFISIFNTSTVAGPEAVSDASGSTIGCTLCHQLCHPSCSPLQLHGWQYRGLVELNRVVWDTTCLFFGITAAAGLWYTFTQTQTEPNMPTLVLSNLVLRKNMQRARFSFILPFNKDSIPSK